MGDVGAVALAAAMRQRVRSGAWWAAVPLEWWRSEHLWDDEVGPDLCWHADIDEIDGCAEVCLRPHDHEGHHGYVFVSGPDGLPLKPPSPPSTPGASDQ